ncbi:MAG: peptide-methionine (R)-S-oxide reductase MsrB [Candidatus Eremiobacteraeota bacterium]|nr:peptide-methionine (R)-S-oxide reductase MsrB [Candidatus Eremiobacteraeota bacterium]MBV8203780.1 peptide-methionine (R)-S-oxide reductase MsrB [Candidatus Eremiobacteraeota bacterium]MBV8263804.1 peptide-methionine (R)-S-oxide reductase MsrB [Candidatus Eremiobacteraeota bacterium]MBV8339476.1 peptide-methionine (R)-S-oxide reductase MsrB [Candidatus Eremiobacteraeota bacterium]MBV8459379.1 peptide-methionine (R)-S-oxide reductase MsrB [Candidatus Eremiobacteraeota bacterium]
MKPTVSRTDEEWKKELSPERYRVLREGGTERAFTGNLLHNKESGTYSCGACKAELFTSDAKYDSGSGWPSFYEPIRPGVITYVDDNSAGMKRTEIRCSACGSHLGHVFEDGPQPTGQRYCTNSLSLSFEKSRSPGTS